MAQIPVQIVPGDLGHHARQRDHTDQVRDHHQAVEGVRQIPRQVVPHDGAAEHQQHEQNPIGDGPLLAQQILGCLGAIMAPPQHRGKGEQHDGYGDENGADLAEPHGEGGGDQIVFGQLDAVIDRIRQLARLQIDQTGGQGGEGRQRADDDGVGKHLEDAPHALHDRFFDIGVGVHHDRRAKAGFIGEHAPLAALLDGQLQPVADYAAASRFGCEGASEDGGKDRAGLTDIGDKDHDGPDHVQDDHEGYDLLRDGGDALKAAHHHQAHHDHDHDARDIGGDAEGGQHVAGDGVDLGHVADAEGGDQAEQREQSGQDLADPFAPLAAAQAVPQVVHGASGPLAAAVLAAVVDAQHVFRVVGHHPKEGDDPHPEHRPGSAHQNGTGHANDVARAHRGRQGRAQGLELGDAPVGGVARHGAVLHGADGALHPVPEVGDLEHLGQQSHQYAHKGKQQYGRPAPHHAVDGVIDLS